MGHICQKLGFGFTGCNCYLLFSFHCNKLSCSFPNSHNQKPYQTQAQPHSINLGIHNIYKSQFTEPANHRYNKSDCYLPILFYISPYGIPYQGNQQCQYQRNNYYM